MFCTREQTYRPLRQLLCSAAASVALLGLVSGGAYAQQAGAAPKAAPPAAAKGEEESSTAWIKLCNTDEKTQKTQCLVTQELRDGNSGQLIASASLRVADGEKTLAIFAMPIGVLLPPGIRIQIDKDKAIGARYTICFPTACVVRMEVDDNFIASMKRGNTMTVSVMNAQQKTLGFPITLVGFTKAFEGPPVPPEAYKKAQDMLTEQIKRHAEEVRKKQEQEKAKQPQ